jgi:ZIP family zinc transporter
LAPVFVVGMLATIIAGAGGTGLGALPVLFTRTVTEKASRLMLGLSAGVMLAASFFSLLAPALEMMREQTGEGLWAALFTGLGLLAGAVFVHATDRLIPHEHFLKGPEGSDPGKLKKVYLFAIAIAIHNFPEGLAVGVGFAEGHLGHGAAVTAGIFLQNMPEGLAVALALLTQKYKPGRALWIAFLTGLVEPLGGLVGLTAITISAATLPWALAFSAGAMLFVISDEVIPETHSQGLEKQATFGILVGFVVMMLLDAGLG